MNVKSSLGQIPLHHNRVLLVCCRTDFASVLIGIVGKILIRDADLFTFALCPSLALESR